MTIQTVPFTILALTPVSPVSDIYSKSRLTSLDMFTLNEAMEKIDPCLFVPVSQELCPEGALTIHLKSIKDFKPDSLIKNNKYLKNVYEAGSFIEQAVSDGLSTPAIAERIKADWPFLPFNIDAGTLHKPPVKQTGMVDDILNMVTTPDSPDRSTTDIGRPRQWKAKIDSLLASLLESIFNNENFRTCEAAWRGIELLLKQGQVKESDGVRLKIMPVNMKSLESALENIIDELVDDLPNLVLIDMPFDSFPKSTDLFKKVAVFADTMLVPTLCWIDARFFHLNNWSDLKKIPYLKHHLEDAAYAKWRKLKELPGADWLSLSCNRFLTRFPYGSNNNPGTVFFQEKDPLWISPIWALGALTAQSIATFGWPCRFTDYMSIKLKDLAVLDSGNTLPTPTEMVLSEDRLMEFIEIGITPLQGVAGKDIAFTSRETTLGGGSLKNQFFTSRILTFLWWYRENVDEEKMSDDLGTNIKDALGLFWQETGHSLPEDLEITAEETAECKQIAIRIGMTPPASILPGGRRLEMTFLW